MKQLLRLYRYAEQQNIEVELYPMKRADSLCAPLPDGTNVVAIDPRKLRGVADETEKLAHELGHCMTGSFYSRYTPLDERGRCETRAERWAIRQVLPYEELKKALELGFREISQLAEYFEVSEEMVRKAVDYYTGPCGLRLSEPVWEETAR